jgi:hypothetical protein
MSAPSVETRGRSQFRPELFERMPGWAKLTPTPAFPTGFAALDAALPGGGWPRGALTELIHGRAGIGELGLLAPALARTSETQGVALISAPYQVCGPGWAARDINLAQLLMVQAANPADRLWAASQALRSGAFGAVLLWLSGRVADRDLRRLQLAAETGQALAFLFRPLAAEREASPAALRLRLTAGLTVDILKSRGGSPRSISLRTAPHAVAVPAPATRCAA